MTLAICWKCGAQKVGALTWCSACNQLPTLPEDQAKSLLLSDHYRDAAELARLGEEIASGDSVGFDPTELE